VNSYEHCHSDDLKSLMAMQDILCHIFMAVYFSKIKIFDLNIILNNCYNVMIWGKKDDSVTNSSMISTINHHGSLSTNLAFDKLRQAEISSYNVRLFIVLVLGIYKHVCDFRLAPRCKSDLRSSGMLRRVNL
jgi:hypothetical protein